MEFDEESDNIGKKLSSNATETKESLLARDKNDRKYKTTNLAVLSL